MNDNPQKNFEFSYYSYDSNDLDGEYPIRTEIQKKVTFDDFTTWDRVLDQFVQFLGHVYGYDISEKVAYYKYEERLAEAQRVWNNEEDEYAEGEETP